MSSETHKNRTWYGANCAANIIVRGCPVFTIMIHQEAHHGHLWNLICASSTSQVQAQRSRCRLLGCVLWHDAPAGRLVVA